MQELTKHQVRYRKYREKILERKRQKQAWVVRQKRKPCADCGKRFPSVAMEFDHLPGHKKLFKISDATNYSKEKLRAEIAKTEVVCANCHAIRTHRRRLARVI